MAVTEPGTVLWRRDVRRYLDRHGPATTGHAVAALAKRTGGTAEHGSTPPKTKWGMYEDAKRRERVTR